MRRLPLIAAIVLTLAVVIALFDVAPGMYPLDRGTPEEFWFVAAQIDIAAPNLGMTGVAIHHGHHWIYALPGLDWAFFSEIDDAAVLKTIPLAETEFVRRVAHPLSPDDWLGSVYTRWKALPAPENSDLDKLFFSIESEGTRRNIAAGRGAYPLDFRDDTIEVARKADFYYLNILFEFIFFSCLIWIALWPFIRGQSIARKISHFAVIPFLFYLPLWFSYAAATQLHGPGRLGGVLYPYLIFDRPLISFDWEMPFLASIPPILSPVSQGATFTNRDLLSFISGVPVHGPTDVFVRTVIFLSPYFVILHLARLRRRQRKQGFPVLPLQSK